MRLFFPGLLTALAVGCSLFGPTDGIADGAGRPGPPPPRVDAGEDDEDASVTPPSREDAAPGRDTGTGTDQCDDRAFEPNDTARDLRTTTLFCGTVSSSDTDRFTFTQAKFVLSVQVENEETLIAYQRGGVSSTGAGVTINSPNGTTAEEARVTITSRSATPMRYQFSLTIIP